MPRESERFHIVVAEDDPGLLQTIVGYLAELGHRVRGAESAERAFQLLVEEPADVLVTDVKLPGQDGLDLARQAREHFPGLIVLIMTGFGSIETAVQAMREGAADYLPKPFAMSQLRFALERAADTRALREENAQLRTELAERSGFDRIIGKSPSMQRMFQLLDKVTQVDSTVLITGESGVGKELIVHALHHHHPVRRSGRLVAVHCGAIPENLIESELFGHVRGAYTGADRDKPGRFELARGGTLFLDEIGTMRPDLQVKLLRVLQSRQVSRVGGTAAIPIDVRVVAASNEDLRAKVERGEFREDLFYRLNVIPVFVPPLRERRSDVPLLAAHFVAKYAARNRLPAKELSQNAMRVLMRHEWPGNVRELENTIEYATVMSGGRAFVDAADLPVELDGQSLAPAGSVQVTEDGLDFRSVVSEIERNLILQSLELTRGNKARAAQLLDLKRTTFVEKLKRIQRGQPTYDA
ncbi:MAG: sigma-54 dependent transcriptional regulator [Acidobacteria bacterium]|jgi:DNA-binding NtrC family response regulator|nr:sigma-54 dependent transcriptional regulator [Acidobacteriota bacterium]